jgi:hypothetical protein
MRVVAIKPAFHNGTRIRVGTTVEVPDGYKGSWFVTEEASAAKPTKAPKATKQEPVALSQMGKGESKTFTQAHAPELA